MDIEFADPQLALIETDAAADTRLPVAVIHAARQRFSIMRAAPDERTLRNLKSLGLKPRTASAEHVVVLGPQWAMAVKLIEKNNMMKVVVTAMNENTQVLA